MATAIIHTNDGTHGFKSCLCPICTGQYSKLDTVVGIIAKGNILEGHEAIE